jgi:hypothetical protein
MNCWEFKRCGYEKICPAYPDNGRTCARVRGTVCCDSRLNTFLKKLAKCMRCSFYKSEHYDRTYKGTI